MKRRELTHPHAVAPLTAANYEVLLTESTSAYRIQHYEDCPCGDCQDIRAARTPAPVPLAWFPCCGATVKLVRTTGGGYSVIGKETHHAHCKEMAA